MNKLKTGLIALIAVITTFTIIGVIGAYGYEIEEKTMCFDYDSSLLPIGETEAFLTTNKEAGVYIKISNPPDEVTFKFSYKENDIWKEYTGGYSKVDVVPRDGQNWGIAFTTMEIYGETPEFKPAYWMCKAYIDGEEEAILHFNIIDIDETFDLITKIREDLEDINEERAGTLADYESIKADYDDLVTQYMELEDSTVSETQLFELNNDYEDLQDDYDDMQKAQASTKSMMYASIVVALVAVVIAVYFGVMKK